MSARNQPTQKKLRRLRKALRRSPPAYFDLFAWLRDNRYVDTNGQARKLVLAGRVKTPGNNTVGITSLPVTAPDGNVEHQDFAIQDQPVAIRDGGLRVVAE